MGKKNITVLFLALLLLTLTPYAFSQQSKLGGSALYNQGVEYYNQGLRRLAADTFQKCLEVDPGNEGARRYLGMIGQAYVESEVKDSIERYEVRRDREVARGATSYQDSTYLPSRNLDYMMAERSSVSPVSVSAQPYIAQAVSAQAKEDFASQYQIRQEAVDAARRDYESDKQRQVEEKKRRGERSRKEVINQTLEEERLKISVGYAFVSGEQSFRVLHTVLDGDVSKLTYPIKGGMTIAKAELKIMPRVFVGGRYAASNFKTTTSKDEDWNIWKEIDFGGGLAWHFVDYQITEQGSKNKASLWDANLYFRAFEWGKDDLDDYISELLLIDRLYIDAFAGYQYYKGKYTMTDPIKKYLFQTGGAWWYYETPYDAGLNSPYEVTYRGPRAGIRLGGSMTEKLSSSVSLSYAWLKTDAEAFWNLRDFRWRQEGKGLGSAFGADVEAQYNITPKWFVGAGFNYMYQKQKEAVFSGNEAGFEYEPSNIERDIKMNLYGISLQTGYRW